MHPLRSVPHITPSHTHGIGEPRMCLPAAILNQDMGHPNDIRMLTFEVAVWSIAEFRRSPPACLTDG